MDWPTDMRAGFAYAAIACDDAQLSAVRGSLTHALATELEGAVPTGRDRRAALPLLLAHFQQPLCDPESLPPRVRGLLGGTLPVDAARRWLAGAPMPRPGFRPDPGLRAWLRCFAERSPAGAP